MGGKQKQNGGCISCSPIKPSLIYGDTDIVKYIVSELTICFTFMHLWIFLGVEATTLWIRMSRSPTSVLLFLGYVVIHKQYWRYYYLT